MAERSLMIRILGDASKFSAALGSAERSSDGFGRKIAAVGGVLSGAFAIDKLKDFAGSAVDKFKEVGGESIRLSRLTGESVETMSRLRFAAQQSGLSADQMSGAFVKLSKSGLGAAKKELAGLGVSLVDATGKARPMNDVFLDVAERFKTMPDGAQKNALALKLFGRSGTDLLPMLNKGRDGLAELESESDKFGNTISGSADALKKYTKSQRELQAATDGLKITIGGALMPIVSSFVGFLAGTGREAFNTAGTIFREHIAPAFATVAEKLKPIFEWLGKVRDTIADFIAQNPQVLFAALGTVIGGALLAGVVALGSAFVGLFSPVVLIIGGIAALVAGVVWAYNRFGWFRDGVQAVWQFIKDAAAKTVEWFQATAWPAIQTVVQWIGGKFGELVGWVRDHWEQIKAGVQTTWDAIAGIISTVVSAIGTAIEAGVAAAKWIWDTFGETIMSVMRIAWDTVSSIFMGAWNIVSGIFQFFDDLFHARWSELWDDVKKIFSGVIDVVISVFMNFPRQLMAILSGIGGWLVDLGAKLLNGLWAGIQWGAAALWDFFKGLPGRLWDLLKGAGGWLVDMGKNLITGLWEGFKSAWNWLADKTTFTLPSINIPGIGEIGGNTISILPHLARGGRAMAAGYALVGEHGAEVVRLNAGDTVFPRSRANVAGAADSNTNVTINVTAGVGNPLEIGRELAAVMDRYYRVNGSPTWAAA